MFVSSAGVVIAGSGCCILSFIWGAGGGGGGVLLFLAPFLYCIACAHVQYVWSCFPDFPHVSPLCFMSHIHLCCLLSALFIFCMFFYVSYVSPYGGFFGPPW